MLVQLDSTRRRARNILINVAKGTAKTRRTGYISYKELWGRISTRTWGRARVRTIVNIITDISAHELLQGRPPLNELVVAVASSHPREPWSNIRAYLRKKTGRLSRFKSHEEAQQACWDYWRRYEDSELLDDDEAEEGYLSDRTVQFRKRNRNLIRKRKIKDSHTCQACKFKLRVSDKYIIDCHHRYPLSHSDNVRVTRLSDLICLCPTCHRIAHTKRHPLSVADIRTLRREARVKS